jgi:hypothetical protein
VAAALVEVVAVVVPVVALVLEQDQGQGLAQVQDPVQAQGQDQMQDPAQAKGMAPAMAQATVELARLTAQVMGLAEKVDTRAMGLVTATVMMV